MASVLTHVQRAIRPPAIPFAARSAPLARSFHQTPAVLKKKAASQIDDGDLFGDGEGESLFDADDLFGESTDAPEASTSDKAASRKLTPEERLAKYNELHKFVDSRIGQHPAEKGTQVRNSAWQHLFDLATTKEQMAEIVEMFPRWRDSKRKFNTRNVELFVRRCEQLKCPTLALQVFSDHPKYGLDLSSLPAARQLLHSLHSLHPLQDTIMLAALFNVYKLPPISSDLVSCALLTSACFKHASHHSLTIANEMIPHLKSLLEKVKPETMRLPQTPAERATIAGKQKAWVAWTLVKIEMALSNRGADHDWLTQWRQATGNTQAVHSAVSSQ